MRSHPEVPGVMNFRSTLFNPLPISHKCRKEINEAMGKVSRGKSSAKMAREGTSEEVIA